MDKKTRFITHSAIISALYVILTLLSSVFGLSSGVVQLRLSEALTILPVFTPAAIPGLFVGCIIANLLTGAVVFDIILGSIATLTGALLTYALRKMSPYLAILPPIISNALIVPYVLISAYGAQGSYPFFVLTVGLGELVSCGVFGILLYKFLIKTKIKF